MNIEDALYIVEHVYEFKAPQILEAVQLLILEEIFMRNDQRQRTFDAFWYVATAPRFFLYFPHNITNPGLVADLNKHRFMFEGMSMLAATTIAQKAVMQ